MDIRVNKRLGYSFGANGMRVLDMSHVYLLVEIFRSTQSDAGSNTNFKNFSIKTLVFSSRFRFCWPKIEDCCTCSTVRYCTATSIFCFIFWSVCGIYSLSIPYLSLHSSENIIANSANCGGEMQTQALLLVFVALCATIQVITLSSIRNLSQASPTQSSTKHSLTVEL